MQVRHANIIILLDLYSGGILFVKTKSMDYTELHTRTYFLSSNTIELLHMYVNTKNYKEIS